ncbi:MAG: DUF4258 domain-containing protein [Candidatus Aenigmarchaeota archaeon]|nr:DUF4258 domain-containing protein [Candidatus Aenigmarchaeota archaeon]
MKIIYTDHAKDRITERFIKKEWVRKALKNPDRLIDIEYGRKQAIKKINGNKISVVYVEENHDMIVITVYWGE